MPSTARVLEQHISRLQARIQELEQDDPTLVRLHDPHAAYKSQSSAVPAPPQQWWEVPEPPRDVALKLYVAKQFDVHCRDSNIPRFTALITSFHTPQSLAFSSTVNVSSPHSLHRRPQGLAHQVFCETLFTFGASISHKIHKLSYTSHIFSAVHCSVST